MKPSFFLAAVVLALGMAGCINVYEQPPHARAYPVYRNYPVASQDPDNGRYASGRDVYAQPPNYAQPPQRANPVPSSAVQRAQAQSRVNGTPNSFPNALPWDAMPGIQMPGQPARKNDLPLNQMPIIGGGKRPEPPQSLDD